MRDLDEGKFIRLRNAIQGAIDSSSDAEAGSSGAALADAYLRFREAAMSLVPEDRLSELLAICPEIDGQRIGEARPGRSTLNRHLYSEAKILLGSLAGHLDGYVEETMLRIQAEEKARLEAEKPPGTYL